MRGAAAAGALCLAMAVLQVAAGAGELGVSAGLAYDTNLYEAPEGARRGWVNRLTVTAAGDLVRGARLRGWLDYQGGLKRYWTAPGDGGTGAGEVGVHDLTVAAGVRFTDALSVSGAGAAKLKTVHRVPGQEGYLRGSASVAARLRMGPRFRGRLSYLRARDASRHDRLPDTDENGLSGGLVVMPSRRLKLRVEGEGRWVDYDVPALTGDGRGGIVVAAFARSDRLLLVRAGAQLYRGGLFDAVYAFVVTSSNSSGYDYESHQLRLLHACALPWNVDLQAYLSLQSRRYGDAAPPLDLGIPEADEYEQTSLVVKAARPISGVFSLAAHYAYFRNGSAAAGGFYRKHVVSLSLDAAL